MILSFYASLKHSFLLPHSYLSKKMERGHKVCFRDAVKFQDAKQQQRGGEKIKVV